MWAVTTFVLESLAFIPVGIEIPLIVHDLDTSALALLVREAVLGFACVVLARVIWVYERGRSPP